jgi:hypothetical protein
MSIDPCGIAWGSRVDGRVELEGCGPRQGPPAGAPSPKPINVPDRLLPLKQTVRHPLDPPSTLLVRKPAEGGLLAHREPAPHGESAV